ncbi:MAG: ABC-F type ribosomal protection protein [Acutalibacteraceae bacterium]|nr:ABC-F type ribosomal protection protein [Acutalibacteraceae bacterium]
MSLINVKNLTFAYDGTYDNIFEDVSFQIDTNWKLGFTGRNGRGKTTFLRLLMKEYTYNGTISSSVDFEYFPYSITDKEKTTIDIVEEICPDYIYWQLSRELNYLEADDELLYRPFNTLSKGEQTKIMLASLFLKENSFLLIDEPTNHLDSHGRKIVMEYLNRKSGFILVSHDRAFLDGCIDHILSINRTKITVEKGNFSSWLLNKERNDNFEIAENEKLKKEISRLENSAKEKSKWSNKAEDRKIGFDPTKVEKSISRRTTESAKAKKMMKRSKQIEKRQQKAINEKSSLLKDIERTDKLKISQLDYHKNRLILLDNVSIAYDNNTVCENINFEINSGDRVALCGKNGSGKSSIIKLICGEDVTYSGTIIRGSNLTFSYVSQDTSFLKGSLDEYAFECGIDETLFKAILRKLDFSRVQFEKNMESYSGGQKKKVLIARSLCQKAHIHIWDEPLNFIDAISRTQIEELILQYQPTMLFVEHDEMFRNKIATKAVEL